MTKIPDRILPVTQAYILVFGHEFGQELPRTTERKKRGYRLVLGTKLHPHILAVETVA